MSTPVPQQPVRWAVVLASGLLAAASVASCGSPAGEDPAPTATSPTPDATASAEASPEPSADVEEESPADVEEESPADGPSTDDLGSRALGLRDQFRADHEPEVAQEDEEAHCYDDQTEELVAGTEAATCFLAGGGLVLFVATDPAIANPADLGVELMNSEIAYTVCVGDDFVIATPVIAAADMVYASGFDCTFP